MYATISNINKLSQDCGAVFDGMNVVNKATKNQVLVGRPMEAPSKAP